MQPCEKNIELNGRAYQYRETGDASAPPLVALHALGEDATSWDEVAVMLGKKYRVLALTQRGHGGSERTGAYSFELMCEDLFLFADAVELERFTLIGHSMGGTVSYLFAEAFPSRIEQLIVDDTPPPFVDKLIEIPPQPSQSLHFDWRVITSILKQLNEPNPEWWTRLPEILAPTLIIGGGSTSHIPQQKLQETADLIPSCELVTIEGAGHNVHRVNLPAFIDAVNHFLQM
jgi:esterase